MIFLSPHSCYIFRSLPFFFLVTPRIGRSAKEWASSEATYYVRSFISLSSFSLSSTVLPNIVFSTTLDLGPSRNVGYLPQLYQTTNDIRILCTYFNQFLRKSVTVSKEALPELNLSSNSSSIPFYHCRPEP